MSGAATPAVCTALLLDPRRRARPGFARAGELSTASTAASPARRYPPSGTRGGAGTQGSFGGLTGLEAPPCLLGVHVRRDYGAAV